MKQPQSPSTTVGLGLGTPARYGHSVVSPVAASSSDQQRAGKSPEYQRAIYYLAKLVLESQPKP